MSKWKTSTRRNRKLETSGSSGNLSLPSHGEPEESDSSSMSFLDDMLGGGSGGGNANGGSVIGGRKHQPSRQSLPPADIDDILDLVGSSHHHHRGSSRGRGRASTRATSSSGLGSGASGASGGSGHHPRDASRNRNTNTNANANAMIAEPEGYYSPQTPKGTRTAQTFTSARHRSHSRSQSQSRSSHSRDPSLDPAFRPPTEYYASTDQDHRRSPYDSNIREDRRQDADLRSGSDHITPIPVFTVNANHDDDTLSQITTSVMSHYDVESSRSASFPWSKQGRQPANNRNQSYGADSASYADTLDEIADMLHPATATANGRMTPNRRSNEHLLRHPKSPGGQLQHQQQHDQNDDFFRPPPAKNDDLFGKTPNPQFNGINNNHHSEAPPLNADEIYRSSKKNYRSWGEPLFSQTRLLFRYWISLTLPREWRRKVSGKDDEQGYLGTYHSQKKVPRSRQRRKFCCSILSSALGFFFCATVSMLLIRLTFMHVLKTPKWAAFTSEMASSGSHRRKPKKGSAHHSVVATEVHGGMAVRSDGVPGGAIVGGMAHHNVDEPPREEDLIKLPPMGEYSHHDHIGTELPSDFDHFADVTDLPVRKGVDLPFFWHIPRAAGGSVNDIFGGCLGLTLASDAGGSGEAGKENKLKKVKFSKHFTYVNVDTSSPEGIERARQLRLADSQLADAVISTLLHQTATLFSNRHRARLFTIIRHPVERAVSLFHFVQDTQWRRRQTFQKELSELSIGEYFESGLAENNWMVRFLINEPTKGELTRDDLNLAKEVLRRKCLVGLLSQKGESFARFERYFGFPLNNEEQKECHDKKLQWAWPLKHRHDEVEENSPLWDLILTHNVFDMELYHYASEVVFTEQAKIFQ